MRRAIISLVIALSLGSAGSSAGASDQPDWKRVINERLPLYGHRNWIVVADSAYPAQARDGIETIISRSDQIEVLQYVMNLLSSAKHVRPIVVMDQELKYVPEADAPGIAAYRTRLSGIFKDRQVQTLPHAQIISKLDTAGQTFRILIIKTNMTLPYTSVFLQLDCAYWPPEAEKRMRAVMAGKGK